MRRTCLRLAVLYLCVTGYVLAFLTLVRAANLLYLVGGPPGPAAWYTFAWDPTANRALWLLFAPLNWCFANRLDAVFIVDPDDLGVESLPARYLLRDPLWAFKPTELWVAGTLTLLSVAAVVAHWWNRVRRDPIRCAGCGYDLHGNQSGVCPECGQAIE